MTIAHCDELEFRRPQRPRLDGAWTQLGDPAGSRLQPLLTGRGDVARPAVRYYPRSNKVFFRGLGLIARLEALEYHDGEPS